MVKIYAAPSLHEHRCFSSTISYQKQTKILWIIDHHTAWLPLICQILSVFNSPHVYWLSTRQPVQLIKKKILCHFWLWSEWEYHLTLFTTSFFFYIYIYLCTPHITTITDAADMMHADDACHIWCSITVYCIENDAIVIRAVKLP